MSTITAPARELTPDDVLKMDDGVRYELVDGRLMELNMGAESSLIGGRIIQLLMNHCGSPRIALVFPEHGYTCFLGKRNRMRRPDVSLILAGRMTPEMFGEGFTSIRPDLVVEVISPGDRVYDLREKLDDYRDAEIPLVWIVHPPSRNVEVIRLDGTRSELGPEGELTGEDVLPGFRCRVAELFAGLPETTNPGTDSGRDS